MCNLGMPDLNSDGGQSSSDIADPVMTAQSGEGPGDGFVEGFGRHVKRSGSARGQRRYRL